MTHSSNGSTPASVTQTAETRGNHHDRPTPPSWDQLFQLEQKFKLTVLEYLRSPFFRRGIFDGIDAHVNHHSARLDPVPLNHLRSPHGGNDDVRLLDLRPSAASERTEEIQRQRRGSYQLRCSPPLAFTISRGHVPQARRAQSLKKTPDRAALIH